MSSSSVSARANADLIEDNHERWSRDPRSVDESWAAFFEGFELGAAQLAGQPETPVGAPAAAPDHGFLAKVVALIYNYQALGHTQAHLDPLAERPARNPRLDPREFGLSEADGDRLVWSDVFRRGARLPLRELVAALEATYSARIGFEFMHIHHAPVRHWLEERIEAHPLRPADDPQRHRAALAWVLEAEVFEAFLGKRFLGEKRFSNEGGEGAMIVLQALLEACPGRGVREIEMGMSHRGRMTVLANFVGKSLPTLLYEFTPEYEPGAVAGDGDVKYHLGYESVREFSDGNVRISLAANPSHLEAVNAVVEGKARARQRVLAEGGKEIDRRQVLPLLWHGDAAFAGQGSVAEVLNLSQLPGYRTGGTIHLVINNQIGFTTMPADARSSAYATDVAKMIEAPILHINGESAMDLYWAAQLALDFRQTFARDFVIDMYCYRRQGHNEADQAAFTQPVIARQIASRPTFGQIYQKQLIAQGIMTQAEVDALTQAAWDRYEHGYQEMLQAGQAGEQTAFSGSTATAQPAYVHEPVATGADLAVLQQVGHALTEMPDGFQANPTLAKRFLPRRRDAMAKGGPIDWALAEALAFGSLLLEGTPVRLSGQDVGRGTFSQRHLVMYDVQTTERYVPLENLGSGQARICIHNSLLSEFAVLGFDYGYSRCYPKMLTLWEAQFGDFANGAQVVIDQFIASAESKWQTPTDLVMLLPHGYEGMGPEHSSARLERFLQLCAEDNLIVANLTTPAQYFHILRRQKRRAVRKPLVLMTPKSLLGRAEAVSQLAELTGDGAFREVLDDPQAPADPGEVRRVIYCSGKVFYDLLAYRGQQALGDTVILRIEQLYPFHRSMVATAAGRYPNVKQHVWCQEEPLNMGAWTYVAPRLQAAIGANLRYAGRDAASSPAAGSKAVHLREQTHLIEAAFAG